MSRNTRIVLMYHRHKFLDLLQMEGPNLSYRTKKRTTKSLEGLQSGSVTRRLI
jgi:hypothetical protein